MLAALASVGATEGLELHWSAPPECPNAEVVEGHLADALAEHEGDIRPVAAEGIVDAELIDDGTSYTLQLTIETAEFLAKRQLNSTDCELLARAAGVVVAVAVDPGTDLSDVSDAMEAEATAVEASVASEPDVPAPPPVAVTPAEAPDPSPPQETVAPPPDPAHKRSGPLVDAAFRVFGGVDSGVLPGASGGVGLNIAATGPRWRVEVQGSRWFPKRATFEGEPDVGADFDLWAGGARGCYVPAVGRLEIPLCVGGEAGQVRARGFGANVNLEKRSPWAAVVVAPGVVWLPRPWVGLFGGVDGFINVAQPRFTGQDRPELHRPPAVTVRALVGVEFRVGGRASRNAGRAETPR